MSLEIRINAAGAGGRIMTAVGDKFDPELHHSVTTYRGGDLQGGFVLSEFTGASAIVSDAGFADRWCTRDLLWMVFDYAFVQLGLRKLFPKAASTNHIAMAVDLRAGQRVEGGAGTGVFVRHPAISSLTGWYLVDTTIEQA